MLIGQLSHYFFGITIFLTSLFLVLLVLVQRGRGGGIAGALGGAGGQSAFGTKAGDLFTRITVGVAAFWILMCCLAISFLKTPTFSTGFSGDGSKMESEDKTTAGKTEGGTIGTETSSSPTGGITVPTGDGAAAPAATTSAPAIDPATAPSVTTPAATTPTGDTAPKSSEPAATTPTAPAPTEPAPTQPTEAAPTTPTTPAATPEAGTPTTPTGDGAAPSQPTEPNK